MKTIVGLFDRFEDAHQVVYELNKVGFGKDAISLISRDEDGSYSRFVEGKGNDITDGTAAGAGAGVILGGLGGLLMSLGVLALPGIGPVLAAGPLVSTLAGAGIGALAGGLVGALVDLGIPDEQARLYSEGIRRGGNLVVVDADEHKAELAATIMNRHNPVDLNDRAGMWQHETQTERSAYENEGLNQAIEIPVTGEATLDYGDLDKDLRRHRNLEDRLDVESTGIDTTRESPFDREVSDVPSTQDQRIDRSSDVLEPDSTTIPLTGSSQNNPYVKEGPSDLNVYDAESARNPLDAVWREHYHARLRDDAHFYADYQLAYRFGQDLYSDPRFHDFRDATWQQVEPLGRREWEDQGMHGAFDDKKVAVRFAWEYVKGDSNR